MLMRSPRFNRVCRSLGLRSTGVARRADPACSKSDIPGPGFWSARRWRLVDWGRPAAGRAPCVRASQRWRLGLGPAAFARLDRAVACAPSRGALITSPSRQLATSDAGRGQRGGPGGASRCSAGLLAIRLPGLAAHYRQTGQPPHWGSSFG